MGLRTEYRIFFHPHVSQLCYLDRCSRNYRSMIEHQVNFFSPESPLVLGTKKLYKQTENRFERIQQMILSNQKKA